MQQTRAAPSATLDAVLERITYANEETGYTVARVATDRGSPWPTATGSSSVMCAWTLGPPATAVGLGLVCTSPGGWPPRTAAGCSSPIRLVLEVPL